MIRRPHRAAADIAPGSNLSARWCCPSCGGEWETSIAARCLGGHGCPTCGRKRTAATRMTPEPGQTLRDLFPHLASEFVENLTHPGRTPEQLSCGSHDRCRWKGACGHEWTNSVKNRARLGSGCPACYRHGRARD